MLSRLLILSYRETISDSHTEHTDALCGQNEMLLDLTARGRHSYHHNKLNNQMITTNSFPLHGILWEFNVQGSVHRKYIPLDIFPTRSNIIQFISGKIALHVSGGNSTHHQEHTQLYLQYLVLVKPLLLPAAIVEQLELV